MITDTKTASSINYMTISKIILIGQSLLHVTFLLLIVRVSVVFNVSHLHYIYQLANKSVFFYIYNFINLNIPEHHTIHHIHIPMYKDSN